MTSDAKIGLLIGLVFIVIIAFLINGLPELLKSSTSDGIINTSVNNDEYQSILIDHSVTRAVAPVNSPAFADSANQDGGRFQSQTEFPGHSQSQSRGQNNGTAQLVGQATGRVRYVTDIPGSANVNVGPIKRASTHKAVSVSAVERPRQDVAEEQAFQGSEYKVQQGDNLAVIAIKFYGSEMGNKKAIVDKLYQANSETLKSPGMLYVGQKLYIPSLKELANGGSEKGLFNKMKEAAGKTIDGIKQAISGSDDYDTYTVEEGDSLWLIAEKTLGNGKRFTDIAAVNDLEDEDTITAGMKLKIPKE